MPNSHPTLGRLLKQSRERSGLTQEHAAEKAGIDRVQDISAYENDDPKRKPAKLNLMALAHAYGLSFIDTNDLLLTAGLTPEVATAVDDRRKATLRDLVTKFDSASREEQLSISGMMGGASAGLARLGGLDEALHFLAQTLIMLRALGRATDRANTLYDIANVHRELGHMREALIAYRQARFLYEEIKEEHWERQVLQLHMETARIHAHNQRYVRGSVAVAKECINRLNQKEEMEGREYRWLVMGEIYQLAGDLPLAEAYTRRSYEASQTAYAEEWHATNLVRMAEILSAMDRGAEALEMFKKATYIYYKIGSPARARMVEASMKPLQRQLGDGGSPWLTASGPRSAYGSRASGSKQRSRREPGT